MFAAIVNYGSLPVSGGDRVLRQLFQAGLVQPDLTDQVNRYLQTWFDQVKGRIT